MERWNEKRKEEGRKIKEERNTKERKVRSASPLYPILIYQDN